MSDLTFIVILTVNPDRAARALASIRKQGCDAEILLVLNDAEPSMRALAQRTEGARIIHDGADLGLPFGWNLGLRKATTSRVCIIHEDVELHDGCISLLLDVLEARPDAGAVGPTQYSSVGKPFDQGIIIWSDGAASSIIATDDALIPADYLSSSCLLMNRDAALSIGGFDSYFFPAVYVDASFGCAMWSSGRTMLRVPAASCTHHTHAMVDTKRGPFRSKRFRSFLLERNRGRLAHRYAGLLDRQAFRSNLVDASSPEPEEYAAARARSADREREVLEGRAVAAPPRPLDLPDDPSAKAVALRRSIEEEFVAMLIAREDALENENKQLHTTFAAAHEELQRVHRAYAELWADRERLQNDNKTATVRTNEQPTPRKNAGRRQKR